MVWDGDRYIIVHGIIEVEEESNYAVNRVYDESGMLFDQIYLDDTASFTFAKSDSEITTVSFLCKTLWLNSDTSENSPGVELNT
ncbi:MAG: hypothetical protein UT34_C0001G0307 [candidate division WS6 bacterium GW2011_GWF2_39_15]|uniref:Uncharacterized protein n=1 Tax=candidate division WS6 bacterium GW2011_GWF2_39_15 TaxID=1619100 RepID=A0A0G0QXC3_9BACT|nr:MAG: hypothetical protein UT34_C0001G0307 [candidate division WS6 bacterium GW2011_GWF2_39_15]